MIPTNELKLIVRVLEAARSVVRQYSPNDTDRLKGAGSDGRKLVSVEELVEAIESDLLVALPSPVFKLGSAHKL
jgi:hypothetical protein